MSEEDNRGWFRAAMEIIVPLCCVFVVSSCMVLLHEQKIKRQAETEKHTIEFASHQPVRVVGIWWRGKNSSIGNFIAIIENAKGARMRIGGGRLFVKGDTLEYIDSEWRVVR